MGSKVRGGHPKLAIFDQNRYKIRFSRYEADFSHKGRSWGVESVKKTLDQKIRYFGRKSKISTKILVIFNDFSWLHRLCDLDENYFFGDLEHYLNNLDQIFFGKLKKNQNFWRISKNSHILGSKNGNKKLLYRDSHFFWLYLLVSYFSINFEKKNFSIRTILSFLFFVPYTCWVARADFLLGAVGAAILGRF